MNLEVSCVVSGSFTKAKPQIDRAIECFEDYHFKVLSPEKGGLYLPTINEGWSLGAYPLKPELHISEFAAKDRHLRAIKRAHFLYICAPQGYVGLSVSMEMATAMAEEKPVYSDELIDEKLFDDAPWAPNILKTIEVKSPEEVAQFWSTIAQRRLYISPIV